MTTGTAVMPDARLILGDAAAQSETVQQIIDLAATAEAFAVAALGGALAYAASMRLER